MLNKCQFLNTWGFPASLYWNKNYIIQPAIIQITRVFLLYIFFIDFVPISMLDTRLREWIKIKLQRTYSLNSNKLSPKKNNSVKYESILFGEMKVFTSCFNENKFTMCMKIELVWHEYHIVNTEQQRSSVNCHKQTKTISKQVRNMKNYVMHNFPVLGDLLLWMDSLPYHQDGRKSALLTQNCFCFVRC